MADYQRKSGDDGVRTGLVSITFRKLAPAEIVDLVVEAGLKGIEWGGDIHVPHGNLDVARQVGTMTRDAGLQVSSYGSYYHAAASEGDGLSFEKVLTTAKELQAPLIRVWAGSRGSVEADSSYRQAVAADLRRAGEESARAGMVLALECHGKTLTDTIDSSLRLIGEVNHPNVKLYWQPTLGSEAAQGLADLKRSLPYLTHVHMFHWKPGITLDRRPLAEGEAVWRQYLELVRTTGRDHWVLLEFVKDDSPAQFLEDAAALKRLERTEA
jgi:sugar phosphate isomerase/epimerase